MTKPYCSYTLAQITDSGLISPDRMAAIRADVESRISEPRTPQGGIITTAKLATFPDGTLLLYPRMEHDPDGDFIRRELLAAILTPDELALVNKHCASGWSAANDARRFEKATKLDRWDGWVTDGERYAASVEEWLDDHGDEIEDGAEETVPLYLWVAVPERVITSRDVNDVFESQMCDRGWDEMSADDLNGVAELQAAIEAFVKANEGVVSYRMDPTRVVMLDAYLTKP